jgi:hypothetical protein
VRDIYLTEDVKEARVLLDKAIVGCKSDEVEEIRSLGDTLERWRTEILNHHRTGASNGPTEGLNLCVKKVKRAGRGFTCFEHYRLRVLLHAGGVTCFALRGAPQCNSARAGQSPVDLRVVQHGDGGDALPVDRQHRPGGRPDDPDRH